MLDRFPRMPHLPGSRATADDVHLDASAAAALLARTVVVTEKLDGLRVEIASARGRVVARLKPSLRGALDGEIERALAIWIAQRDGLLAPLVRRGGAVYGEWLMHRVTVAYDRLPDFFVAFALRGADGRFLANDAALEALAEAGLTAARPIFRGRVRSMVKLRSLLRRSGYGRQRMEGLVVAAGGAGPDACAKLVRGDYEVLSRDALTGAHNTLDRH